MWVQKLDANRQPVLENGQPVYVEIPDALGTPDVLKNGILTKAEAEELARQQADKARGEEKRKLYNDLEQEKQARLTLETQLKERDKLEEKRKLEALPADQQTAARLSTLESELARERGERLNLEARSTQQVRTLGLVAYRERALRDVHPTVHNLVGGSSEEEIDASVDDAQKAYADIQRDVRTQLEQEYAQRQLPPPVLPGAVPAPPPNPAYVVPPHPQAAGGFPTPTNPLPVSEGQPQPIDIKELTSEDAVRSGRYGGELRASLHRQIRGNQRYQGNLGSAPRHWSQQPEAQPMPQQALPGGGQSPQGFPTGAVTPPGMAPPQQLVPQQQPQVQQQVPAGAPQPHPDGKFWANNVMNAPAPGTGTPGARQAHAGRFAPTPPVNGGH